MTDRNDFIKYARILAIDPSYSFTNGCGWAIFDEDTGKLLHCGLVRPFAPGGPPRVAMKEIIEQLTRIWEEKVGFHYRPVALCIERPQAHRHIVMASFDVLGNLRELSGRIDETFKAAELFQPTPLEWKNNASKDASGKQIMMMLDKWSINHLKRDLLAIKNHLRHNTIDAVGLGLYALNKLSENSDGGTAMRIS